jgi:hypothetical protein
MERSSVMKCTGVPIGEPSHSAPSEFVVYCFLFEYSCLV